MLAAGIHPKIASERLGHSRIGITLSTHVIPGMQGEAATRVDARISNALSSAMPSGSRLVANGGLAADTKPLK